MMAVGALIPSFVAQWNNKNVHLKVADKTLFQKICKVVWDILSIILLPIGIARAIGWAVHFTAKKLVLPSAWFYPRQIIQRAKGIFQVCCRNLQNRFDVQKHRIVTPDGVNLKALHFRHRQSDANTPTILFYQSNASISQLGIYLWLIEESVRRNVPCNFVVFDYRGVGSSLGDATSTRELLIDGDTALQFVQDHLRVPPQRIHWYGWSLGGGISTNIKAMHPECTGPLVNERSFESLRSVFSEGIPPVLRPLFFWLPCTADRQGWNITAPLKELKGRNLIVYHRKDPTIPYPSSAHQAAIKANIQIESIELYQTEEQIAQAADRFIDHHFEDLSSYYAAPGLKADQAIANFILPAV